MGFEPTPLRTGASSQRLRPLGQTVDARAGTASVCRLALWEACVACLAPNWKAGDTGIERLLKAAVDPAERSVRGLGCAGDITFR